MCDAALLGARLLPGGYLGIHASALAITGRPAPAEAPAQPPRRQ
jgi:hypothetical protein